MKTSVFRPLAILLCTMAVFAVHAADTIPALTTEMFWERTFVPSAHPRSIDFVFMAQDTVARVSLGIPARPHDTLPPFPVRATVTDRGGECRTYAGDLLGLGRRDAVVVRLIRTTGSPWVYFSAGGVRQGLEFAITDLDYGQFTVDVNCTEDVRASDTFTYSIGDENAVRDYDMLMSHAPRFATVGELEGYLATSTDLREGIYRYMDRDMDAAYAVPGGYYDLAVVRMPMAGPETYCLLYLSGATHSASAWKALMPKGMLRRTEYLTGYDLVWRTTDGGILNRENNGDFGDGAILTLRLPLYHATLRFVKKLKSR